MTRTEKGFQKHYSMHVALSWSHRHSLLCRRCCGAPPLAGGGGGGGAPKKAPRSHIRSCAYSDRITVLLLRIEMEKGAAVKQQRDNSQLVASAVAKRSLSDGAEILNSSTTW